MGAAAGGAAAALAVTWVVTHNLATFRFRTEPAVWRRLLQASLPLGLALAINEIYFRVDTVIISLYEPYDEVGLYTLAYRILEFTLALGAVYLTTVFPLLSERSCDEPMMRMIQAPRTARDPGGAAHRRGGSCWRQTLIELAGGEEFEDAATPLRILLAAAGAPPSTACSVSR